MKLAEAVLIHNVAELAKRLSTLRKTKRLANQDYGIIRGAYEHGRYEVLVMPIESFSEIPLYTARLARSIFL